MSGAPAKKMYKQKGTGGARHGSARVRSSAAAAVRSAPSCARMPPICRRKVRGAGLRHALYRQGKDGGLIVIDKATLEAAKTKALVGTSRGLG